MRYYIIPESGVHISPISVQPFSDEDTQNPDVKKRLKSFNENISTKLANNETLEDVEDPP